MSLLSESFERFRRAVLPRRDRGAVCPGCGRALDAGHRSVIDVDQGGGLARYHQGCAPSISAARSPLLARTQDGEP
jgi:hypothetical protein